MIEPILLEIGKRYKFRLHVTKSKETVIGYCFDNECYPWDINVDEYIEVDNDTYIIATIFNIEQSYSMIIIDVVDVEFL